MERRAFLAGTGAALLTAPLAGEAQTVGKVYRIGYLGYGGPGSDPSAIAGLRQGLRELGYVENQNIVVEYRYAEDRPDRLAPLIAELTNLKVGLTIPQSLLSRADEVIQ